MSPFLQLDHYKPLPTAFRWAVYVSKPCYHKVGKLELTAHKISRIIGLEDSYGGIAFIHRPPT